MMSWFRNKKENRVLPLWWKEYEARLKDPLPVWTSETTFVALDTETTGFDVDKDRILCIGAVRIEQSRISLPLSIELYIRQEQFDPETVHIHGLLKREHCPTLSEIQALEEFVRYLGNAVIVAHHTSFDLRMINAALQRNGLPKLKNKWLDTMVLYRSTRITSNLIDPNKHYSLDEVAQQLDISVKDRHTAAGDALITALAFLKILNRLSKGEAIKLKELLKL